MLTIFENDMPPDIRQTDCPVKRGNWIIGKAEEAGMMMPLIINRYYDGAIVVRGVKREQKTFPL